MTARSQSDNLPSEAEIEPLAVRVGVAVKLTGLSRSRLYELMKSGDIDNIKVGRSTLVTYRSLKKLLRL